MSVLFIYDHKFNKVDNKFYSTGTLDDVAVSRYTKLFGKTTLLARIIFPIEEKRLSEIKNKDVIIIDGWKLSNTELTEFVLKSEYIVVRMPSFLGLRMLPLIKKAKKPYLIEFVGDPWDALWQHSIKGMLLAPVVSKLNKNALKIAPFVVYVTNEYLQKKYPTKGRNTAISNVALIPSSESILSNRINKISSLQGKMIIIGTAASVSVRYKGQQYVIEALGKLKNHGVTNFRYQLVGDGDQSYLKKIAEKYNVVEKIDFLGTIPHNQIFDWLDTIDIYAQPSRTEGLPRALIEAMSRALPCFGARAGGIPELLESNYIFSNTRSNINEICKILRAFDEKTMMNQAERNFIESLKYDCKLLEGKRSGFFKEFMSFTSE